MRIHRRCPSGVALEDLLPAGTTGLIQAVDRDDSNRNLKLRTFAEHRIQGAILDYLRQLVPLTGRVRQFQPKRDAICRDLEQSLNQVPSATQIADAMGISSCKYQQLGREAHAGSPVSLEGSIAEICSKAIASPDPEDVIEKAEQR